MGRVHSARERRDHAPAQVAAREVHGLAQTPRRPGQDGVEVARPRHPGGERRRALPAVEPEPARPARGAALGVVSWGPARRALWDGKWAIGAPLLILGGIYSGAFTPTEAAAVAVFYALFVGVAVHRELTVRKVVEALRFTSLITGLLILLTPTLAFGQLSAFYDVPAAVEGLITAYTTNVYVVLILIAIFYIVIGTFMESLAQIILFTSVFLPLVTSLGVDPVAFGILTVITCEIGFLTPPLGGNLNVAARISGISIEAVSVAVLPFILAYCLGLVVLIFVPELSLWLPNLVYGPAR